MTAAGAPATASGTARPAARAFGHAQVFGAIFALSFLAARGLPLLDLPYRCPFLALTGVPCASCGMTHAFVHLAHGAVGAALAASPFGAVAAAGCWTFALVAAGALLLGRRLPRPSPAAARRLVLAGAAALVANWAFLVVTHGA